MANKHKGKADDREMNVLHVATAANSKGDFFLFFFSLQPHPSVLAELLRLHLHSHDITRSPWGGLSPLR